MAATATHKTSNEGKIFVVSLHRTMTRSVDAYLSILGYQTIHYPKYIQGINIEERCRGMEDQPDRVVAALKTIIDRFDACGDIPFPTLYQQLARQWPDSRFILVHRDPADWVKSVRDHVKDGELTPFRKIQYGPYLGFTIDRLKDVSDQRLTAMYDQHTADVEGFFNGHGQGDRLCLIRDFGSAAEKISTFLNRPVFEMPWITGGDKGAREIPWLRYWQERRPDKADPCYYLAKLYYQQKDYRRARAECRKAVELDPFFHKPRKLLVKIKKRQVIARILGRYRSLPLTH